MSKSRKKRTPTRVRDPTFGAALPPTGSREASATSASRLCGHVESLASRYRDRHEVAPEQSASGQIRRGRAAGSFTQSAHRLDTLIACVARRRVLSD